jgi:hypothetical protein
MVVRRRLPLQILQQGIARAAQMGLGVAHRDAFGIVLVHVVGEATVAAFGFDGDGVSSPRASSDVGLLSDARPGI